MTVGVLIIVVLLWVPAITCFARLFVDVRRTRRDAERRDRVQRKIAASSGSSAETDWAAVRRDLHRIPRFEIQRRP